MKNRLKQISILSILLLLAACNDEENMLSNNEDVNTPDYVILKERDPHLPKEVVTKEIVIPEKSITKASGPNGEIIGNSDALLGHSYTIGNSIMGDYLNVLFPVVDIQKVKSISGNPDDYITPKQISTNITNSFAYSNFDRYENLSVITKKVASGFSINLGVFKFGRRKTTTEVFTDYTMDSTRVVYGELDLKVRNSAFSLIGSEGARKLYARECLSKKFMKDLYGSTSGNILNTYGDFVLTGYITGGRAFGLYKGFSKEHYDYAGREKDMKTDINMSFYWNSGKNNVSLDSLNFGKGNKNLTQKKYNCSDTEIQIRTYGGKYTGQAVVGPASLDNLSLDLSSWVNSLDDVNSHTIIDILDQGLYPMSAFVLESNFKRRFDDSYNGVLEKHKNLKTPYIEIARVYVRATASGEPLYEIAAVLNTRQRDKIVLSDGKAMTATDAELKANDDNVVFTQKANEIKIQKENYFGLEIGVRAKTFLNPIIRNPLCIKINGFNENNMYRYKNPRTGMEYIYDTKNKTAFSYFTDELDGDWILDDYGIRDWVESLPTKTISMATLANSYTIIGL